MRWIHTIISILQLGKWSTRIMNNTSSIQPLIMETLFFFQREALCSALVTICCSCTPKLPILGLHHGIWNIMIRMRTCGWKKSDQKRTPSDWVVLPATWSWGACEWGLLASATRGITCTGSHLDGKCQLPRCLLGKQNGRLQALLECAEDGLDIRQNNQRRSLQRLKLKAFWAVVVMP